MTVPVGGDIGDEVRCPGSLGCYGGFACLIASESAVWVLGLIFYRSTPSIRL